MDIVKYIMDDLKKWTVKQYAILVLVSFLISILVVGIATIAGVDIAGTGESGDLIIDGAVDDLTSADNETDIEIDIPITGADAGWHDISSNINETTIWKSRAQGDGAGGIISPRNVSEGPVYLREQGTASTDAGAYSQLWAKNAVPSELWYTDDTGIDYQLALSGTPALTDTLANVTARGATTTNGVTVGGLTLVGTPSITDVEEITATANATDLVFDIPITGADANWHELIAQLDGKQYWKLRAIGDGAGGTDKERLVIEEVDFYMTELTSSGSFTAGYGQVWVKDDTPNTLWFTDDLGTDIQIATASGLGTFVALSDTPVNYVGAGSQYVKVNAGETGLEFVAEASATGTYSGKAYNVFVAASNAPQEVKDAADIVAGSSNAQIALEWADGQANGGAVGVSEGVFNLDGDLTITDSTFVGQYNTRTGYNDIDNGTEFRLNGTETIHIESGGNMVNIGVECTSGFSGVAVEFGEHNSYITHATGLLDNVHIKKPDMDVGSVGLKIFGTATGGGNYGYVSMNDFGAIEVFGFEYGIWFYSSDDGAGVGFVNANNFESIVLDGNKYGTYWQSSGGENAGNVIKAYQMQARLNTADALYMASGQNTHNFVYGMIGWDWSSKPTGYVIHIASGSNENKFDVCSNLPGDILDNGSNNVIFNQCRQDFDFGGGDLTGIDDITADDINVNDLVVNNSCSGC